MIRKFYNYYLSKDKGFARELTKVLGFVPKYLSFYMRAFTHKSLNGKEDKDSSQIYKFNNERLEFLGDAILDSVTAEYLFKKYPTKDEGFLTQMRSKMVNRKMLNYVAAQMNLDLFLKERGAIRISQTMMGNTFEAFVGAIYLDVGYYKTKDFIIRKMLKLHIDVHELETTNNNYKSQLLEHCQKSQKIVSYEVVEHYRTKNNRERFKVAVLVDTEQLATAEDFSKKSAEQSASKKALIGIGLLSKKGEIIKTTTDAS